ncbi:LysR family transcriptional regulator [Alkalimarinus coralli]|uniref:LysR family transcriptional regulator n=1 Tax=Alkalimarinus coralli TaxID=2935863 RepID=UPI00202B9925|nr:LysR family transcriptional regulator [Alkalimarinus coralli]
MDLKSLKYFVSVYESGSITAASKRCYVAQPSISSAINQLEDSLDSLLFVRVAKGVIPTEAGKSLYPLAKKLLSDAKAINNLFRTPKEKVPFRLGLIRSLGAERVSALLKELANAVDEIELTLLQPEENCDARIITTAYLQSNEHFQPLWRDHYYLALPIGHPLSLKPELQVSDLNGLAFIYRTPCEAVTSLEQVMSRQGAAFQVRARIQTVEYALGLVGAGIGSALIPSIPQLISRKDIVLKEISDIDLSRTVGLAYSDENISTEPKNAIIDICRQQWSETHSH